MPLCSLDFPGIPLNLRGLLEVAGQYTEVEQALGRVVPEADTWTVQSQVRESWTVDIQSIIPQGQRVQHFHFMGKGTEAKEGKFAMPKAIEKKMTK